MRIISDALKGAAIGVAEVIPGVSGGTIALILRVYQMIIRSASGVVRGMVSVGVAPLRRQSPWADVEWSRILPLIAGMFVAIFIAAAVVEPLLVDYPVYSRALFAGLITMSLVVPIAMVGSRWLVRDIVWAGLAAVVSFILVGLPSVSITDPSGVIIALSAAVAVCALVLPGVSGSFLLLTLGMYEPTLKAVNDRDIAFLAIFVGGAIVGLGLFVVWLQWLLENRRRITLVVMTGLMLGSLRALWPWQASDRELLVPDTDTLPGVLILFFTGVAIVAALLAGEKKRLSAQAPAEPSA
jgi:putative membrane protein